MEENLDITKLKYVLYARKSTDDPQRQVRSTEDQISECEEFAKRNNIHIVGQPIVEKKSAKVAGKRPLFHQMLKDIRSGLFDGIIAWHPDRLSRNMKEGGEIIDMIDEEYIKDLKFVTHHFSNDASGKMLLGMAFVLSKHYSDNLSQNVTRGVRKNLEEGKFQSPKHGYIRDKSGLHQPDGKNFDLIVKAWQMRKEGDSLIVIVDYLNANGYGRIVKSSGKKLNITKQILSDIFRDPFYYGLLIQAHQEVDLRQVYDFQPAITEQDYIEVQRLSGSRIKPFKTKKRITYYPLRMMISCSFCNSHMYAGASRSSSSKKERYLFYRCDNKFCTRKKRSIRARPIFDFIYNVVEKGLNFTKKEYEGYLNSMKFLSDSKREKIQLEIHSKQGKLKSISHDIKDISYKLLDFGKESLVKEINEKRVVELQNEKEILEAELVNLKSQIIDPDKEAISFNQFLNLSKNAAAIVKSSNVIVKDQICRLIFLNFTVDEDKVLSYQAKEPFATLLKQRELSSSRG